MDLVSYIGIIVGALAAIILIILLGSMMLFPSRSTPTPILIITDDPYNKKFVTGTVPYSGANFTKGFSFKKEHKRTRSRRV
jgi:uncharacterized membrane protein YoaK (UPF0700 family)